MVTCRLTRPITAALADWQRFSPSKSPSAFSLGQSSRCSRPDAEVISALALVRTRARVTREPQQSRSQFITGSARAEWAPVQHHQCERAHARVWEMSGAQRCSGESEHEAKRLCTRNEPHDRSDPAEGDSAAVVSYCGSVYSVTHRQQISIASTSIWYTSSG